MTKFKVSVIFCGGWSLIRKATVILFMMNQIELIHFCVYNHRLRTKVLTGWFAGSEVSCFAGQSDAQLSKRTVRWCLKGFVKNQREVEQVDFSLKIKLEQILRISSYGTLVAVLTIAGPLNSEANRNRARWILKRRLVGVVCRGLWRQQIIIFKDEKPLKCVSTGKTLKASWDYTSSSLFQGPNAHNTYNKAMV